MTLNDKIDIMQKMGTPYLLEAERGADGTWSIKEPPKNNPKPQNIFAQKQKGP